jgi:hypothetical protein
VCNFIADCVQSVVRAITVTDILDGRVSMPFSNPTSWKATQQDCSSLRRTYAHLAQGTRPTKKMTNIKDIKRYLRVVTLSRDGLIVVNKRDPFAQKRQLIVIPNHVVPGLLTALHLRLQHPTKS